MKKLLSLTLSLLMVFSLIPAFAFSAFAVNDDTVCVIGDTEYSSLFGADGALANAVEGDTIVLKKDVKESGAVSLSGAVTLDLAGHNIINYGTSKPITAASDLTIRSTVSGLGKNNTENKPDFKYSGTLITASAKVDVSNVNFYEASNFAEYDESKDLLEGVDWIFARYRYDSVDKGLSTKNNYTRIATETLIPVEEGVSYFFTYETTKADTFKFDVYGFDAEGTCVGYSLGQPSKSMLSIPTGKNITQIGVTFFCSNNEWGYNKADSKLLPLMNKEIIPSIYKVTEPCSFSGKNTFVALNSDNVKLVLNNVSIDQTVGTTNHMSFTKGCEFDVNNSVIKLGKNNNNAGMNFNNSNIKGSFKNTTITMVQGIPVIISSTSSEGLIFDKCSISQNTADQTSVFTVNGGNVKVIGGTTISGSNVSQKVVTINGGNVDIDDAKFTGEKGDNSSKIVLNLNGGNVSIGKLSIVKKANGSGLNVNDNAKLLSSLKPGYSVYSSTDYNKDTILNNATDFRTKAEIHIAECGHFKNTATCLEKGICDYCKAEVEALGHNPTEIKYNDAEHWYKCIRCDYTEGAEAHKGGKATCTEKAICDVCSQPYGEPLGHSFTNYQTVDVSVAGCEHNPVKKATCDRADCNEVDYDYSESLTNTKITKEAKEPTCTEKGYTAEKSCIECGKVIEPSVEIDAKGHDYGEEIVDVEPTYRTTGKAHKICKVETCKYQYDYDLPVKAYPEDVVAVIGETGENQYTSLFGADGAFAAAKAGETVILVRDTTEYFTSTIDKEIILDLAGYTLTSEASGGAIVATANITVRSTINGDGEINTPTKAKVLYGNFFITGSAVTSISNISSETTDVSLTSGSVFVSGDDAAELIVRDSYIGVKQTSTDKNGNPIYGKNSRGLLFTSKAVKVDFENVTVQSGSNNNNYGVLFNSGVTGIFKDCQFNMQQGNSVRVDKTGAEGIEFSNCEIKQNEYDQNGVLIVNGGTVKLTNGTVVDGRNKASSVLNVNGGTVIADDITVKGDKGTDANRRLVSISDGNPDIHFRKVTLLKSTAGGGNGKITNSNEKLLAALDDDYAMYSRQFAEGETPNGEYAYERSGVDYASLKVVYIDKCNHDAISATCTAAGGCLYCNRQFEALGHDKAGYDSDETNHWIACSRCGLKADDTTVEAHRGGKATCKVKAVCEVCGSEYGELTDHNYTVIVGNETEHWKQCEGCDLKLESEKHHGGKATCTQKAVCEICNNEYGDVLGHSFTKYVSNNNATCTEDGTETAICDRDGCNEIDTRILTGSAKGHDIEIIPGEPATCTTTGITDGSRCTRCDKILIKQEIIPVSGYHVWDQGKVTLSPTCKAKGSMTYTCLNCGVKSTVSLDIVSSAHKLVTKNKAADYFTSGYKNRKVCSICGKTVSNGTNIAKKVLKTPKVTYKAGKKKITVKYKKVTGATGFQVQYRLSGKKSWTTKNYSSKKSLNKAVTKLKSGKKYNIRIRAKVTKGKKNAYSKWTKTKTVKVK